MTEKAYIVDDKKIYVYDNMFTDDVVFGIAIKSTRSVFQRKEYSNDETKLFYSAHFELEDIVSTKFYKQIVEKIYEKFDINVKLQSARINAQTFGDMSEIHIDSDVGGITVLYYINEVWDKEWGGETVYYEKGEPVVNVLPKSGRIALADSRISHVGRSPTRQCTDVRQTLALKFERVD
jgi:Rps23 Pro-64 3,4-dihydroxylase Tpa1-like proline 4-hydroxylase